MSTSQASRRRKSPAKKPMAVIEAQTETEIIPYDENLLERARTQWQFGDWQSLAKLDRDTLQHHPDRAKLALLAASGCLQTDNASQARQFIRLAQDWGCSNRLIVQILAAGIHNSLGRAAAIAGHKPRALKHFESAIVVGTPGSDIRLIVQARIGEQCSQLGLIGANNIGLATGTVLPTLTTQTNFDEAARKLKDEIKAEVNADIKANNPNPYAQALCRSL